MCCFKGYPLVLSKDYWKLWSLSCFLWILLVFKNFTDIIDLLFIGSIQLILFWIYQWILLKTTQALKHTMLDFLLSETLRLVWYNNFYFFATSYKFYFKKYLTLHLSIIFKYHKAWNYSKCHWNLLQKTKFFDLRV